MKKLYSIVAICLSLFLVTACGSSKTSGSGGSSAKGGSSGSGTLLSKIKKRGYVIVGFSNEAPYAYKENGKLKGAAVEVAKAVFKRMGVKVRGQLADWGQLIPSVKAGKIDAITAGMAIKPSRCKQIAFSDPTIVYGEGIAVKKGNPDNIHSYKDIAKKGVKVAVLSGGTEVGFLKQSGVKKSQMMMVSNVSDGFAAVKTGRAAVSTATQLTVKKAVQSASGIEYVHNFKQPKVNGVPSYGAAGFNKNSVALRKAYNKNLEALRKSGKLKKIITSLPLWDKTNLYKGKPTTTQLCQGKG